MRYGVVAWHFGSLRAANAYLNGDDFVVVPNIADLGNCEAGSRQVAHFTVINFAAKPMRVVGSETDCNCVSIGALPMDVGPHERRDIPIEVATGGTQEDIWRSVIIHVATPDERLGSVPLHIRGRIGSAKRGGEPAVQSPRTS